MEKKIIVKTIDIKRDSYIVNKGEKSTFVFPKNIPIEIQKQSIVIYSYKTFKLSFPDQKDRDTLVKLIAPSIT